MSAELSETVVAWIDLNIEIRAEGASKVNWVRPNYKIAVVIIDKFLTAEAIII